MTFCRIANPKKPGETLVISKADFDPAKHELVDAAIAHPADQAPAETPIDQLCVDEAVARVAAAPLSELTRLRDQEADARNGGRHPVISAIARRQLDSRPGGVNYVAVRPQKPTAFRGVD